MNWNLGIHDVKLDMQLRLRCKICSIRHVYVGYSLATIPKIDKVSGLGLVYRWYFSIKKIN